MPTYEYHCKCCNTTFEDIQSIKSEPLAECPHCHVSTSNRLISGGTSFLLKGEGWSSDNYSKKS